MISKFRKGADTLFVKILLGLIALSFVAVGGSSLIKGNSSGNIVSFSNTDSIPFEKFQITRAREIDSIQKQNGIHLTEENIANLGIDNTVLKKLINSSMIDYLAKHYDFDISDEKVISFVKDTPFFKNQKGEFDLSIFKSTFNNSIAREEEYLESIKQRLITSAMVGVFKESFNPPKMLKEIIVNYMAEVRIFDLFSIDLNFKPSSYQPSSYSEEELKQFYLENKTLYILPETRNFSYIKADKKFLEKKIDISEDDIKNYFDANKEEFNTKKFADVKKQIKESLYDEKLIEVSSEIAKNFEEDVSGGLTMQEIAAKYDLPIKSIKNISSSKMSDSVEFRELADNVFEMSEGEVSYPIEISSTGEIVLVNVLSTVLAKQQDFKEVEKVVIDNMEERDLVLRNIKTFKETLNDLALGKANKTDLSLKGISLSSNLSVARSSHKEHKLPEKLIDAIFTTELAHCTDIVSAGNKAYATCLVKSENDQAMAKKIHKRDNVYISNIIKEGVFQELIAYLTQVNNMKIKVKN